LVGVRRQDGGKELVDLDVVSPRDPSQVLADLRPQIAKCQAERIGLVVRMMMLEVSAVGPATFDELPE
jgi:hypothetical protein